MSESLKKICEKYNFDYVDNLKTTLVEPTRLVIDLDKFDSVAIKIKDYEFNIDISKLALLLEFLKY